MRRKFEHFNGDFGLTELEKLVEAGEVAKRPHPSKDLFIYSYLKTWYPEWTETLKWARGLILDSEGNLIACPFKKFFNYSEIRAEVDALIANGVGHRIQDKLDGSLGILFFHDGEWHLSTKGSFSSEQSFVATDILHAKYKEYLDKLDKQYTYLFEIIYPSNQIVVKYNYHALVLLAVMDPTTMQEVLLDVDWPDKVKHFDTLKVSDIIKDMSRPEYCAAEGFVVVFDDGTRVKFKYDEYVRLHKIVSDFKPKNVIEFMKSGQNVDDLIASLPDEFRQELIDVRNDTNATLKQIGLDCLEGFSSIKNEDKKTFALENVKQFPKYKAILFEMWKDYYQKGEKELSLEKLEKNSKINEMMYDIILESLS